MVSHCLDLRVFHGVKMRGARDHILRKEKTSVLEEGAGSHLCPVRPFLYVGVWHQNSKPRAVKNKHEGAHGVFILFLGQSAT